MRLLLVVLLAAVLLPAAPADAAPKRVAPCSRGLVALTFDDGPLPSVTPRLVRVLTRLDVPATFFMVGNRVESNPELVRMVDRAGFAIGNHTWEHADLTSQTPRQVRRALASTGRALHAAGVEPTDLVRPPYGATDERVRKVIADLGLVEVLWTIDSLDWSGLSARQITDRIVERTRPHRTNLVLQHDGVTNSPATLRAMPEVVARLQKRGFCFAGLDASGRPTPPAPVATVRPARPRITEGDRVRLTVRLDRPTTRATRVRVAGTTVWVPAGRTSATTSFRAPQDRTDERPEDVTVYPGAVVRVLDDDPPPVVSIDDAGVTADPLLPTPATIVVRLDRMSDRPTPVVVRSELDPTRVVVPPLTRQATGTLEVPVGTPREPVRDVDLRVPGSAATLTVRPPEQTRPEAVREAVAQVRLPVIRLEAWL